jgi:rod shape-determining protein MreC
MRGKLNIKIIAAVFIAFFLAGQFGWVDPIRNFFIWATRPLISTARSANLGTANAFSSLFEIRNLQKENGELRSRLEILETENASLKTKLTDLSDLEKAMGLKERSGFHLTGGRVVSTDPTSLNQTLLIDRGSANGVVADQAVVDPAGAYIGRITRVLRNTAEVTLISDVSSRIPSEIAENGVHGVLSGQHALSVSLTQVPQGKELPVGGRVVTTGFTPGVPSGLLIGYIERIYSGSGELFQSAHVRPAADLRGLGTVFIITGGY